MNMSGGIVIRINYRNILKFKSHDTMQIYVITVSIKYTKNRSMSESANVTVEKEREHGAPWGLLLLGVGRG